jgi:hypothetical protein
MNTLLQRLTRAVAVLEANGLIESVSVEARAAGDTFGAAETYKAHRMPQTSTDAGGLAENRITWALYKIATQARNPNRLCKITDPDGVVWIADSVEAGYGRLHFRASCTKALD